MILLRLLFMKTAFLTSLCAISYSPQSLKSRAERLYYDNRQTAWTQCCNGPTSGPISTLPRDTPSGTEFSSLESGRGRRAVSTLHGRYQGKAVLLNSHRGHLLPDEQKIPEHTFTVTFWYKPEGGQSSPAIILDASDSCLPFPDRGWTLGIENPETSGESDLRLFFSLHTWSKQYRSKITSPFSVITGRWCYVAAVYDGQQMALFVDGARVAVAFDQGSYSAGMQTCRSLFVGGRSGHFYRGRLDDLRVWDFALNQSEIRQVLKQNPLSSNPIISEDFDSLDKWEWKGSKNIPSAAEDRGTVPVLVPSDIPPPEIRFVYPSSNPCGHTICDSPEVVRSYKDNWILRKPKVVRYRVIVVSNSNGSNPSVTPHQIHTQQDFLQNAFERYNISWELEQMVLNNTDLRRRRVLLNCNASMVGNGKCEPECRHAATNYDGGDCELTPENSQCLKAIVGNGHCDSQCNKATYNWDGGDCCSEKSYACFDPLSPHRSYMDVEEFKSLVQLNNSNYINILFAHWTNRNILGVATFPWEKNVFTEQGGIVLQPSFFGMEGFLSTLVHEMGHALGLWHVHRGVSELDCRHPCYETEAAITTGDLCEDTKPTPANTNCHDPSSGHKICGQSKFVATPFTNYMGYADDTCAEEFTPDQVARMHCYLDLVYPSVQNRSLDKLPPPPLAPKIVSVTSSSLTLTWLPTLSAAFFYDTNICLSCSENLEYSQYGYKAESSVSNQESTGPWSPQQALGAPDSETCVPSYKAWLPGVNSCSHDECTLTVHFQKPSVGSLLMIWVAWNAFDGVRSVKVYFNSGSSDVIDHVHAQCDAPLTIPLFYKEPITKIMIKTLNEFVSIDAVKLVSVHNNPVCSPCKPFRYRLLRNPPFPAGESRDLDSTIFTDRNLKPRQKYVYQVQAWLGSRVSEISPTLIHIMGSAVCGDGLISSHEECDDGGVLNGDGCNSLCSIEKHFYCRSEPSLCYWYEDDGVCEDFERETQALDCGFYTPKGFYDQWAFSVETGLDDLDLVCLPTTLVGPPKLPLKCKVEANPSTSPFGCNLDYDKIIWITATFPEPVVATAVLIYFASDGVMSGIGQWPSEAKLQLLDIQGQPHFEQQLDISCNHNPQEIPVVWDMNLPLNKTLAINITFISTDIVIEAIQLRSSNFINPVVLSHCEVGQLYHPVQHKCEEYCSLPSCLPLQAKHAHLNCTGNQEGDTCTVLCDPGHDHMKDQHHLTCVGGKWKGQDPNCKPIDCGSPFLLHADAVCPNGTTFGKSCSYKCRPPARFLGGSHGLATVVCESNGLWSQPKFLCQVICSLPSPPDDAVLISPRCSKSNHFVFGQRCKFRCKSNFHVQGFSSRKKNLYLYCDATASWSGKKCVPVTCPSLGLIQHNCTSKNTVGSSCIVQCNTQHQKMVESIHYCESEGTWEPPLPECASQRVCHTPKYYSIGVQFLCNGNHIGAMCKAICNNPEEQPIILLNGDVKTKIQCEANGQWSHRPEDMVCKKKCIESYEGDGYCDARNNQQHCRWDGGDCCSSTVIDNIVKPFPDDCGQPCSCFDPKAEENQQSLKNV